MSKFTTENQPENRGRPKGSTEQSLKFIKNALPEIIEKIVEQAKAGDLQACSLLLDRAMPKIKTTATGVERDLLEAQTKLTNLKVKEIEVFEDRLRALESLNGITTD